MKRKLHERGKNVILVFVLSTIPAGAFIFGNKIDPWIYFVKLMLTIIISLVSTLCYQIGVDLYPHLIKPLIVDFYNIKIKPFLYGKNKGDKAA